MAVSIARLPVSTAGVIAATTPRAAGPRPVRAGAAPLMLNAGPPAHRLDSVLSPRAKADLATGGDALLAAVRSRLEETFGVGLGDIRVHTDQKAQQASAAVGARAFTYGHHIFLGPGESPTDVSLLAHEVAHVLQQLGSAPTMQMLSRETGGAHEREAHHASEAAMARAPFAVLERTHGVAVQRWGLPNPLDWIADHANAIPGFRMLTLILGVNPINMSRVERTAANVLRAVIELLPGGNLITQALDNYGIIDRVGNWISQQIDTLGLTWSSIRHALSEFIDSLGVGDLLHLGAVWDRAVRIFTDPINRIINFGRSLVDGVIRFIKDAILRPLANLASQTRAWDLLCAVLGRNPITGDAVPRNAETLIGGFMKLINQEEIWQNIQRANAIPRAFAWFQGALEGLLGLARRLPQMFLDTLRSLEISDIILLPRAFMKVAGVFGSFFGDFFRWAGTTIWNLLEIIFEVLAPAVMPYLKKAASAFRTILRDPIGFIRNLVRAGIQGFRQFAANFLTHLRASLVAWLTGALGGANIYIPQAFNFREIVKFVLSVLGLTWQNVRSKLVRRIGETAVAVLETTFDIVLTLVRDGPAAAWEKIQEALTNLQQMVTEGIMNFVRDRIVQAAITRLVTSLNPAGAFIQAILAIYNTIMFLVERLSQIARVVGAFIDSISAIANGVIAAAADRVEQTMEGLLTLVISFLARLVGLGRVSDAVVDILNRIRQPIDRALDRVIDWIVTQARRLGQLVMRGVQSAARRVGDWWGERRRMSLGDAAVHTLSFARSGQSARLMLASEEKAVELHLQEAIAGNDLDDAAKGRARDALQFFNTRIAPLTSQPIPAYPPPALQALIDALPDNLNTLSAKLVAISQGTDVPLPSARWTPAGPQSSRVELLTNRTSRGGEPARSGNPRGWQLIVERGLTTANGNWVRMHMITAGIGGQDVDGNLLPAPTSVNTGGEVRGFETRVEQILYGNTPASEVRAARSLFKRLTQRNAVIWVETITQGFWPAYQDPSTSRQLYDGATFATSVTFKAGIHVPRNNDWSKDPTPVMQARVGIPQPNFTGTYRPCINDLGRPMIARLARIDENDAREIVDERSARGPFRSRTEFVSRMVLSRSSRQPPAEVTARFRAALDAVVAAITAGTMTWR
jgi:hypothetical protein